MHQNKNHFMEKKKWIVMSIALMVALVVYFIPLPLGSQAQTVLAITALAMVLWISEVIPLHATAVILAILLATVGGFSPDKVFAQFFDKVVVLLLGGYMLAVAMSKHKLDEYLARKLLGRFGTSSHMALLGVIVVTAFLSMWMSNSAAAAIALPIAIVLLVKNKMAAGSRFGTAMVLGVAYGATIGGIGTLVGSTPNVLSQKFLTLNGVTFGFLDWGIRGFPFMIVMVVLCWMILLFLFKPEKKFILVPSHPHPFTPDQKSVIAIFLFIVFLWVTESVHGIHNSITALLAVVLLYTFQLVDTDDFHKVGWDSLVLIGGGIALGMAIDVSGLDDFFSAPLGSFISHQPFFVVLLTLGIVGVVLTSFLSNTAASAVLIPVITSLSTTLGMNVTNLVVGAAIGVSMDFIFPMGTPPSALAYSSGYVRMKEMILAGVVLSLVGAFTLALMASLW